MSSLSALVVGESRGASAALSPVVFELLKRGILVDVVACGNEEEKKGFNLSYPYSKLTLKEKMPKLSAGGYSFVVAGTSSSTSLEIKAINEANRLGIPTIGVSDQNSRWLARYGTDPLNYPTLISLMDEASKTSIIESVKEIIPDITRRCFISGWTAFDSYSNLKNEFKKSDMRQNIRNFLGVPSNYKLIVLFSNIFSPNEEYYRRMDVRAEESLNDYFEKIILYQDAMVTLDLFRLQNKNISVIVSPHPGESVADINNMPYLNSRSLAKLWKLRVEKRNGYSFEELCMASDVVIGGPTTAVSGSCMLDIPTICVLYGSFRDKIHIFPAASLGAIPIATTSAEITDYLELMVNTPSAASHFSNLRKRFSTDGNASRTLVDEIIHRYI